MIERIYIILGTLLFWIVLITTNDLLEAKVKHGVPSNTQKLNTSRKPKSKKHPSTNQLKSSKKFSSRSSKLGELSTDIRFDGSSVLGKVQSAPETVTTVENDKYLDELLGVRRNFADRIKMDQERQ